MVTHGSFANNFWGVVEDAATRASRDLGVELSYRVNEEGYDLDAMRKLIEQAVSEKPDGLAISLPDVDTLGPAIKSAVAAGIPVVSLNSGSDNFQELGLLAHFGQVESYAGTKGCERFKSLGAKKVLVIDIESGANSALVDRADGCAAALPTKVIFTARSVESIYRAVSEAFEEDAELDAILALNSASATPAIRKWREENPSRGASTLYATFDFDDDTAQFMKDGNVAFSIDQQQYLQGYLPVVYLATLNTTALRTQPNLQGGLINTGPGFITIDTVDLKKCESSGVFFCGEAAPTKDREPVLEQPEGCECIARSSKKIVAVSHSPTRIPATRSMLDGLRQGAKDQKIEISIKFRELGDEKASLKDLDDAIAEKPYGIISTAPTAEFVKKLKEAREAGIKVVTVGSPAQGVETSTDLFVGYPPHDAGRLAGAEILRKLSASSSSGKVLCIKDSSEADDEGERRRCDGAAEVLEARGTSMEVIGVDGTNPSYASRVLREAAADSTVPIVGMLAISGHLTRIATLAANQLVDSGNGSSELLPIVGFDMPSNEDTLTHPSLVNVILTAPYLQGYWPVVVLAQAAFSANALADANDMLQTAPYQADTRFSNATKLFAARCELLGWEQCLDACDPGSSSAGLTVGECTPCAPGTFANVSGLESCYPCERNTYSDVEGLDRCKTCPGGTSTFGKIGQTKCEPCQPGTYLNMTTGDCMPCPVGTSTNQERSNNCIPCNSEPGAKYQDEEGQRMCKQCPAHTHKPLGQGGVSISECLCAEGYWRPDGVEGAACIACPEGAICDASTHIKRVTMPKPKYGFWTKTKMLNATTNDKFGPEGSAVHIIAGFPFKRDNSIPKPEPTQDDFGFGGLPKLFLDCPNQEDCPGNIYECSESKRNALCIQCKDAWFNVGGYCLKCPLGKDSGASIGVTIAGWAVVILIWLQTNAIAASRYECFDVTLLFMQIVNIIQSFSIPWPEDLRVLTNVFAIVNFDVDFLSPACILPWDYVISTYFTYMLPLITLGITSLLYIIKKLRLMRSTDVITEEMRNESLTAAAHSITRNCATLLVIVYNAICIKAFSAFMCTEMSDGQRFLNAAPDVACGSSRHHALIGGAVVAIPIYVVGTPLYLSWKLWSLHRENLLHKPEVLKQWGFLYMSYEANFWWWPILFLVRRLVFCLLVVFASEKPYIQLWIGVIFLILAICLQYFYRPFLMPEVDFVDSFMLIITAVYLMCGSVYMNQDVTESDRHAITVFLLISTVAAIAVSIVVIVRQARVVLLQQINAQNFVHHIAEAWMALSLVLHSEFKSAEELMKLMDVNSDGHITANEASDFLREILRRKTMMAEILFMMLDTDRSGTLTVEEIASGLYNLTYLNEKEVENVCSNIFDAKDDGPASSLNERAMTWIHSQCRHTMVPTKRAVIIDRSKVVAELNYRKRMLISTAGELTSTINSLALSCWLDYALKQDQSMKDFIVKAALIDQWVSPHMADDGDLGIYSYSDRAVFLRSLVKNPSIIDYILTTSEHEVAGKELA